MAQPKPKSSAGDQALEMTMRDVLDGLEEFACYISHQDAPDCLEILSIEPPPKEDPLRNSTRATVHNLHAQRNTDIAGYLIARERRRRR